MTMLQRGNTGDAVKVLQHHLNLLGYVLETEDGAETALVEDGIFGEQTELVVKQFQQENHLDVDGIVGPNTDRAIMVALTSATAPTEPDDLTKEGDAIMLLVKIMSPNLNSARAKTYYPLLHDAMSRAEINTPLRQAHFLAQLAQESQGLKYFEELGDEAYFTKMYEGAARLGNTEPGDGALFHGRGPIQLTGRDNYTRAGDDLGLDLVNDPDLAALPENGFRIATWFWTKGNGRRVNLNTLADRDDLVSITRAINGGLNGLENRRMYLLRAKRLLRV